MDALVTNAALTSMVPRRADNLYVPLTDFFNESSLRFKAKLGARRVALRVQVTLWDRWSRAFTLQRY